MKSGTATKLLLEAALVNAHSRCFLRRAQCVKERLLQYKQIWERVYREQTEIAKLIQLAGESLRKGGHLYYMGSDSLGIMGLIDASECPPTYGATFDDVRGFLEGGYEALSNVEGDLCSMGGSFQISIENFSAEIVPSLCEEDLVIFICKDTPCVIPKDIMSSSCAKAYIHVNCVKKQKPVEKVQAAFSCQVSLDLCGVSECPTPEDREVDFGHRLLRLDAELGVKWTLNAVSTGAHILKGKVYSNIMIDLKPSNAKLFQRATGIIQRYSKLPHKECEDYLLRSLYDVEQVADAIRNAPMAQHIRIGATKPKVVPRALLAAVSCCTVKEADATLEKEPVLRQAIVASLSNKKL